MEEKKLEINTNGKNSKVIANDIVNGDKIVNQIETNVENANLYINFNCGNATQYEQILQGLNEINKKIDDKNSSNDNQIILSKKQDDSKIEYIVENNILDKKTLLDFKGTRGNLLHLFFETDKIDENGIVDAGFVSVMNTLLCYEKFNSKKYDDLKKFIINKHKDNVQEIISERLDIIKHYFEGENVVLELKSLLKKIEESSSLPKWMVNDVAMDLKNMTSIFEANNYGLKFLNESKEFVYYPIGDKLASNTRNKIIKMYRMLFQENPTTSTISSIRNLFDDVSSYFCVSFLYGSLTHILIFKSILQELFYALYLSDTNNVLYLNGFLKLSILLHDDKQCDAFNRRSYDCVFSNVDFRKIYNSILLLPFEQEQNLSKLVLLAYYGYYIEDDIFQKLSDWFFDFLDKTLLDYSEFFKYNSYIEKTIEKCFVRFDNTRIASIVLKAIDSNNYRVRRFSWKIFRYFSLNKLDDDFQNEFKKVIVNQLDSISENDRENFYGYVVIPFCKNISINYDKIEEKIIHYNQNYYENYFKLELKKNNYDYYIKQLDIYVCDIRNRIKNSKNGVVYGFVVNPFLMIRDILYYSNVKLPKKYYLELLFLLKDFLLAPGNTINDKCDCALLFLVVLNTTRVTSKIKKILLSEIEDKEGVKKYQTSPFENSTSCTLEFYYDVLLYFLGSHNILSFSFVINKIFDMPNYDKMVCLKLICDLTKCHIKFTLVDKMSMIQLSSVLSRHEERDISYLAVKIMCNMYNKDTAAYILEHFRIINKFVNQYSKELIVRTLKKSIIKDSKKNEILADNLKDNNYYVRMIFNK